MARAALVALACLLLTAGLSARADEPLPPGAAGLDAHDTSRLEKFDAAREKAIADARGGGKPGEVRALNRVLEGNPMPVPPRAITGRWRCRTIKLGGNFLQLVIYADFKCRISKGEDGLVFEKLTGSQRTSGRLTQAGDRRWLFAGAGHYDNEKPRPYGADPERNEVGYLVRIARNRLRLEMPLPTLESHFDILELRR